MKWYNSIRVRFLFFVLGCSSIITLVVLVFQLWSEWNRDIDHYGQRIIEMMELNNTSLSSFIWNVENDSINNIIVSMEKHILIDKVEIVTPFREYFSAGVIDSKEMTWKFTIPLLYEHDKIEKVGEFTIYSKMISVRHNFYDRILWIGLSQFIKTFIISFLIVYGFHKLIGRHLDRVIDYMYNNQNDQGEFKELLFLRNPVDDELEKLRIATINYQNLAQEIILDKKERILRERRERLVRNLI